MTLKGKIYVWLWNYNKLTSIFTLTPYVFSCSNVTDHKFFLSLMPNYSGNNLSWNIEVNTPYPIHHCCRAVTYFIHLLKVQFPALCFQAHWGIRILFSPFLSSRILTLEYKSMLSLLRIFFSSCLLSQRRQTQMS